MVNQFKINRNYIICYMKQTIIFIFTLLLLSSCSKEREYTIEQLSAALKAARPGDTITIANGTYKDVNIQIYASGNAESPIIIRAKDAGKVYIEGNSNLELAGEYITLSGFYFRNGYSGESVIQYRTGEHVANHCRITNCVIEDYNPDDRSTRNAWVALYGRNNRFDHNTLIGKQNSEATLIVQLNEERSQENNHSIDHNYFGPRPNYGSNGAETIRVGNSTYSLISSNTRIVNNWFEHCDGEVEHVSIKSCDNLIARNVFYECSGELVLRHGNRNTVEENVFIGNRKPHTGGIRIVNADQVIRNNYLEGLTGKRFYAALAVMNAVPDPLPNRYHQVENALIEGNKFVRCDNIEFGVGADFERTVSPANTLVKDNLFYYPEKAEVFTTHTDMSGIRFENNKAVTASSKTTPGIQIVKMESAPEYTYPVKKEECGASWYSPGKTIQAKQASKSITVEPGQNTLVNASEGVQNGDKLILKNGATYIIDRSIPVSKQLTITTENAGNELPVIKYNGTKGGQSMITILDGGKLYVSNIVFDGATFEGKARVNAGISPAKVMRGTYSAWIDNCTFKHFEESSFAGFKALKNSFADTLSFNKCTFHDISGEGIGLGAEKNDDGKYSVENIFITDCNFRKILNTAVNLYRGGNDESTTGPTLHMKNCTFEDCSNQERGAALRLIGAQTASLDHISFKNSGRGGAAIKFDECRWDDIRLSNIRYDNSGRLRMNSLYK